MTSNPQKNMKIQIDATALMALFDQARKKEPPHALRALSELFPDMTLREAYLLQRGKLTLQGNTDEGIELVEASEDWERPLIKDPDDPRGGTVLLDKKGNCRTCGRRPSDRPGSIDDLGCVSPAHAVVSFEDQSPEMQKALVRAAGRKGCKVTLPQVLRSGWLWVPHGKRGPVQVAYSGNKAWSLV